MADICKLLSENNVDLIVMDIPKHHLLLEYGLEARFKLQM
jgi:hypothetical protein